MWVFMQCDLLERKLEAGVRVKDYVPSYGSRENNVDTVKKCLYLSSCRALTPILTGPMRILDFQSHFKEIAKQNSPEQRRFYVHLTTVIVRTFFLYHLLQEGILMSWL